MRRPRVLRNLRIDEVSSVDKGAGDGVRIVLMKRDSGGTDFAEIFGVRGDAAGDALRAHLLKQQARDRLRRVGKVRGDDDRLDDVNALSDDALDAINDQLDDGDDSGGSSGGSSGDSSNTSRHISHLADLICEAKPGVTRSEALDWLLHTKSGQALVARTKRFKQQQERQMQPETFSKMVADMGVTRVCKAISERGFSTAISEMELTEAITAHAKRIYPDERPDKAFAKVFTANDETGIAFRKAVQIVKGMPRMTLVPTQVGDESVDDGGNAYDALMAKAAELRKADGSLSEAQAFSRVYRDNPQLAQAERRQARARLG